ncbi:uncharacterized protein LOC121376225 [Gigantopelta aegis]|uniref:uncharacterized protein LOC121376225 n=1 Tax=Gigantopelta aegis TaxID=1735272 RepID=UPI001B887960|nr:uncharacterized protein LOC121376225 [Gigantopelta aegis]
MEDGGARRRLQFCDEHYKNKTFYIDVKTKSMRSRVSSAVTQLGGTVESFLSKDIFMFITDAKTSRLQNCLAKQNLNVSSTTATTSTDISLSNYSAAAGTEGQHFSGVGSQNVSVMSRGRALLMKARENSSKDSKSTNNSVDGLNSCTSSAVTKAFQMGLKIEHAINFLRKCKNVGVAFKVGKKQTNEDLSGFAPLKWDDKNFIKYEDMSKQYRPIFRQLENIPTLYTENYGGSPFDGPTFLHKVQSETTGVRKEMKGRKFTNEKGGYCEMCAIWFTRTLKEHMYCSDHVKFVKNKDNFSTLDTLVSQLPTVSNFLAKFVPSSGFSVDNKNNNDQPPSEVEMLHKSDPTSTIHESMCGLTIESHISANTTSSDSKELVFPNKEPIPLQDVTGDKLYDSNVMNIDTGSTVSSEPLSKEPIPLQEFTGGKLFDSHVLNIDPGPKMFSSDFSQSESPSTVLKDLLSNWTLQDSTKLTSSVEEHHPETLCKLQTVKNDTPTLTCPTVPGDLENYSGTTCSYSSTGMHDNIDLPMSLGTPILSLGCHDDNTTSDVGQLKLKMVYGNGESVPLTQKFRKKLRKVKHKNKENSNIYCSRKTSDTKLKLLKVSVTPLQQKCNLKMFWQVRKTGDCKLVFSSRKRKNVGNDLLQDNRDGETEKDLHSRRLKRQRLVF